MADATLMALLPLTGLGRATPAAHTIGTIRIVERFDVALASLASRRGRGPDVARAAQAAHVPLPEPGRWQDGVPYAAFWVAPELWLVEAPFATHEDIVAHLKPAFGDAASLTEQTDAWIRFDLSGTGPAGLIPLLERLCTVDFSAHPNGYATRTVMDHLGCYLIKRDVANATLYGPRSSAKSLLHAVEVAAASIA